MTVKALRILLLSFLVIVVPSALSAQEGSEKGKEKEEESEKAADPMKSSTFSGLKLRSIGPALTSGRISDFAVDPNNRRHYYVAVASGGVWKTPNAGTTWIPVFDSQASYSIGAIAIDPHNPSIVWVGTGENNSQRSVSYGNGVYRTQDGGRTWKNMGLKKSEHIGKILLDPRDTNTVYVAAQGPLWGPGGDRGLYKTNDGGKNWKKILEISENTGVTDVVMDPRDPGVLYAAAYQRRRRVWTLIDGGPEGAIYKSTDGGENWTKLRGGLPSGDVGRIGLAIAPSNPDIVYATVEAAEDRGGIFRSTDRGATWQRRNPFDQGAMYYGEIVVDPKNADRIYLLNTRIMVSDDGGRTLGPLTARFKHVDNHAMWIDPDDTDYYLVGCDGGIYESFDRAANWHFKANLPVTQFYDITVDNDAPFYNVYGGTQDNFTLGGPARTRSASGITNTDWDVVRGGDGFHVRVDPEDPDVIYAESQYAGLVRFNRRTGVTVSIRPREGKEEKPYVWNWDSPLLISPHSRTRLYFAANKLFRSDDRGDSWKAISGELSRGIDRNTLEVMGKVWSPEAVAKHASTSIYGNSTALSESPLQEGLIYVGTDDGLIHVTEDGGAALRKIEKIEGVPEMTYVARLLASQHDAHTVYAAFDNHKNADFKPYILKSTDAGRNWTSVSANLPENGPVLAIAEDHVNPNLLFVGTEFGLFFTVDGGKKWVQLKGGLPTIAVRDLAIQKRENDLAVGTFGRGIYILDDYIPLRRVTPELLAQESALFPVKETLLYIETRPLGRREKGFQGASFYTAPNPPYGATFTYYLKESIKTKKQQRKEAERKAEKAEETPPYPTVGELRAEQEEEKPVLILTVADASGRAVSRLTAPASAGLHRVSWDLRLAAPSRALVMPGTYTVSLAKRADGELTPLAGPEEFSVVTEGWVEMSAADRAALVALQEKVARLQNAVTGAFQTANELKTRMGRIKQVLDDTPAADHKLWQDARSIEKRLDGILIALRGDPVLRSQSEPTPPSILQRVNEAAGAVRLSVERPTQTHLAQYEIASEVFAEELAKLRTIIEVDLKSLEKAMEEAGAPWTPGRLPDWRHQLP